MEPGPFLKLKALFVLAVVAGLAVLPVPAFAEEKDKAAQGSQQELMERIEVLEKQIRRLEEEAKARRSLEITEEEKAEKEKEVLSAVSRDYTLDPKGTLALDYSINYSYSPSENIYSQDQILRLERVNDHTIQHSIYTAYSVLDNFTASLNLPVMYRYAQRGTDDELDETNIGDISLGAAFQPFKMEAGKVRYTLSMGAVLPTGRSPYKINPKSELSTGNGLYSVSLGANFSKQIDPVVFFWGLGYSYPLDFNVDDLEYHVSDQLVLTRVKPGSTMSANMGMGYALSYANSINMSFSYSYQLSSRLTYNNARSIETGDRASASFGVGMGINVAPKTTMSVSLGYSLTGSGFSLTARVPFNFVL
ncbi:MAG TPA: transporter [Deltaproteobacteria bacterium]|nr:transporter [Deltaproteobacteria bacterium]HOM30238.1 transporter [Deltaproteobacteria bacterium]HPP79754.1 transporter [Deltaproteobacteria bacterium]